MNDPDPSQATVPTPPPLPAAALPIAPHGQSAPIGYASAGLPVPCASARPRARVVVALSWALVGVHLLMVWPAAETVRYWVTYPDVGEEAMDDAYFGLSTVDFAGAVLGLVFVVLYVVATVFWFMWLHRAYRNLRPLGAEGLRWTPGWAVGYFFVPILNLFRPYQVMSETWRASDPGHAGATDGKSIAAPALLGWWWAMHLVSSLVGQASFRMTLGSEDQGTLLAAAWIDLAILPFDIALLLVEIWIVQDLTERQERRADAVGIAAAVGAAA